MEQIGAALQQTLEPNAAIRKQGEDALRTLQATPGYINQILELVVNEEQQVAPQIRMAAAVALKNFVKRNWVRETALKNITEKTECASLDPIYDTNWSDMPSEIKSVCIGKMKFKERLSLRCTAKAERSLVDSQKVEFDEGRFWQIDEERLVNLHSADKQNFFKRLTDMNDTFELLNYIKKVGVFESLHFSVGNSFAGFERLTANDGLFTAKEIEFKQCSFRDVVAVLRKLENGVESIKMDAYRIDSNQLAEILAISHVQDASYWHIKHYNGTDSLQRVAQMWTDNNSKVGSTFQLRVFEDGSFGEFLQYFDDRNVSKNEKRVRIRTNNPDCHILLERGFGDIAEIDELPQFFRLKVISAEMQESEYEDCRQWVLNMDPEMDYMYDSDNSNEGDDDVSDSDDDDVSDNDDAINFSDSDDNDL